jgi:predicted secreted protein
MKKNVLIAVFVMVAFIAAAFPAAADSAEDYKVIKNAVKGKKSSDKVTWFKLEVTEKGTEKSKVKIKVPVALIDLMADCVKKDVKIKDGKCDIDLKKIMKILKEHGPMTVVEIEDDDCTVKIWFE